MSVDCPRLINVYARVSANNSNDVKVNASGNNHADSTGQGDICLEENIEEGKA